LQWAEDCICSGVSALLLVFLRLHTQLSPVYLIALLPYFWRLLSSDSKRALWLGVLVANSFVFVAYADNLIFAPAGFVLQLTYFNLIFASYGVAVSRARGAYGRNALLLVFLWLPLEYCLSHVDGNAQVIPDPDFASGQAARFTVLLNVLIFPAFVILLNPLLLLLASHIVDRATSGLRCAAEIVRKQSFCAPRPAIGREWFYFPDLRSPPARDWLDRCSHGRLGLQRETFRQGGIGLGQAPTGRARRCITQEERVTIMKSTKRISLIFGSAFLLSVFMLLTAVSPALGETQDETITVTKPTPPGNQYKVNFTGQAAANAITLNLDMYPASCENIRYANATTGQVTIRNTSSPAGQPLKPNVVVAASQTSTPTPMCCPNDVGQWLFEVGDGIGGDPDAVVTINVTCNKIPTLSEWAMIIFSVVLLGLMTYYVIRRRRVANSVAM
jgi:hypothetical protein